MYGNPRSAAPVRLFCFPHGGAGASAFRGWPRLAGAAVDVAAVQLPGREGRILEPPCREMPALVRRLGDAVLPWLDRPFAFFGHSMGALVAFELARELRRRRAPLPVRLIVSAHHAPQRRSRGRGRYRWSDERLVQDLRELNGTPPSLLDRQELLRLWLPTYRADCALCETYRYGHEPPLPCAISAFGGRDDPFVTPAELRGWRRQTAGAFELRLFPGDHFFAQTSPGPLLRALLGRLRRDIGARGRELAAAPA